MRPLLAFAIIVLGASSLFTLAQAQDRGAELDKAVEEAKAAYLALQEAEKRRDAGVASQAGERIGTVGGDTGGIGGGPGAGGTPGLGGGPAVGGGAGGGIGGRKGGGGARQTDEYWQRQEQLEREVAAARQRYEAAQKRWNDLK